VRAAVGLVQLGRLEERNATHARIVQQYLERLDGVEGLLFPCSETSPEDAHARHLAAVLLPEGASRPDVQNAISKPRHADECALPADPRFSAYADGPRRPLPETEEAAAGC
jgi:dTDP-4-amino-4,6-dideoxygalactose transaminase